MSELLELCGSDDLSLDALQKTINSLGTRVSSQSLCFHRACMNENVTLEIVQLLYSIWPDVLQLRDNHGWLPIHYLCYNKDLDDTSSIDILRFMLDIDHTLPREVDDVNGCLPIQMAVQFKSTRFCKILIDAYPESLRIESGNVWLPIHVACRYGNQVDTADIIQYMLELDPELINVEGRRGYLPIHWAAIKGGTKSIELLLKYDSDAASMETDDRSRWLPLHFACSNDTNLSSIQVLYDAYPEAIFARDRAGGTPLDLARGKQPVMEFLQTQLVYAEQSRNTAFMTTVENGWLPLRGALKNNASLGSIKLLTRANPAALQGADQNGVYPLHIACEFTSARVVQFLIELDEDIMELCDANEDSLLHYACRGGNLGVVKYLLERNVPSVSERNNDNMLPLHLLL